MKGWQLVLTCARATCTPASTRCACVSQVRVCVHGLNRRRRAKWVNVMVFARMLGARLELGDAAHDAACVA